MQSVAAVWYDAPNEGFQRMFCRHSDLYQADILQGKRKGHAPRRDDVLVDIYPTDKLVPRTVSSVPATKVYRCNAKETRLVPDMTMLTHLDEPNMLQCLQARFDDHQVYTMISGILVAVNPYRSLPLYTPEVMASYRGASSGGLQASGSGAQAGGGGGQQALAPHIFALAEKAYCNLVQRGENQALICCGESGSGKTESTKMVMRYLASVASASPASSASGSAVSDVERQVLQANPILEAFGNAKTLMNHNSSRFAKFTKLYVSNDATPRIVGAHTETYLLERSRIIQPSQGERNFHVFYQLCASPLAAELGLGSAEDYYYLSAGQCTQIDRIDDAEWYAEMRACMDGLRIAKPFQDEALRAVAAVMFIGNVDFDKHQAGAKALTAAGKEAIARAAELLRIDAAGLEARLTTRNIQVRAGESYVKQLSAEEAVTNRDSIAKAIYQSLFEWVVLSINKTLYDASSVQNPPEAVVDDSLVLPAHGRAARRSVAFRKGEAEDVDERGPSSASLSGELQWIGVLDIFGFEKFAHNSFEQFCINFANEKLQQYFNEDILQNEQNEYKREGIFWVPLNVPDNSDVIQLVASRPSGILCLLDSACIMPKGNAEVFHGNLLTVHGSHPRLAKATPPRGGSRRFFGFSIRHFAGQVTYDADMFLLKNADAASSDTIRLLASSRAGLIRALVADDVAKLDEEERQRRSGAAGRAAAKRFRSVGSNFAKQLTSLMDTLMSTTPYFVRCASPNDRQVPHVFSFEYVRKQLVCGGLVEALRMLKFGYPSRVGYHVIEAKYAHVLEPNRPANLNARNFCEAILVAFGLSRSQYQLGLTKVFFRPGKQEFLDSIFRQSDEPLSPEMERAVRKWLVKRRIDRAVRSVHVYVRFRARLKHIRAAHNFRRAVRRGMIYISTLRACLYRVRRLRSARANAVPLLQRWWRHYRFRRSMLKALNRRVRAKRKNRFRGGGDSRLKDELNVMRVQMEAAKRKQKAEQARLAKLQAEADAKERKLKEEMEAKAAEMERLKSEMLRLAERDEANREQAEQLERLKAQTESLRAESENAARAAREIVKQREAEYARKVAEMERHKAEAEEKRQQALARAAELEKAKEEEARRREEDLAAMREETEHLRAEQQAKAREAQRLLEEKEAAQARAQEELARIQAAQEQMLQSHQVEAEELRAQHEADRKAKEAERARLQAEVEAMKREAKKEATTAREAIRQREEENRRRERELANLQQEQERTKQEMEDMARKLEREREAERAEKERAVAQFKQESAAMKKLYEQQAEEAAALLKKREKESLEQEQTLQQLAEEAEALREKHQRDVAEAAQILEEERVAAQREMERVRAEQRAAQAEMERQAAEEMQRVRSEMAEQLANREREAQSEQESLEAAHEEAVAELQMAIIDRDMEIERLMEEADQAADEAEREEMLAAQRLAASQAETAAAQSEIAALRAEMERMRQAHAEVNAISERLLKEQQEEAKAARDEAAARIKVLEEKNAGLTDALDKLDRDHQEVLMRFQEKMAQSEESRKHDSMMLGTVLPPTRARKLTVSEQRPDFEKIMHSSILAQKTHKDFVSTFKDKSGWLAKRRPGNRLLGRSAKVRFVMLEGDRLSWYEKPPVARYFEERKPLGALAIKEYHPISYDPAAFDNDSFELLLTPRKGARGSTKNRNAMVLTATKKSPDGQPEDLLSWVHDFNRRISVLNYLDTIFVTDPLSARSSRRGCRELVEFITDASATVLAVENQVTDIHGGLITLAEPLYIRPNLLKLVLNNIGLSDPSVDVLSKIVARSNSLVEMELMHNLIGDDGARSLADALRENTSLCSVRLKNNQISDDGCIALADSLPHHINLHRLTLSGNKISCAGACAFASALEASGSAHQFHVIEFAENLIKDEGAAALARLVRHNKSVEKVDLANNLIGDAGAIAFARAIAQGDTVLEDLRLSSNSLTNAAVIELSRALDQTKRELLLDISHNSMVSRTGVKAIVENQQLLQFQLLRVVRHVKMAEPTVVIVDDAEFDVQRE